MTRYRKHYHYPRYSSVNSKLTKLNDGWWCYCVKIETIDIDKLDLENDDDVDWDLVIEYLNQEISDKVFRMLKNADRITW